MALPTGRPRGRPKGSKNKKGPKVKKEPGRKGRLKGIPNRGTVVLLDNEGKFTRLQVTNAAPVIFTRIKVEYVARFKVNKNIGSIPKRGYCVVTNTAINTYLPWKDVVTKVHSLFTKEVADPEGLALKQQLADEWVAEQTPQRILLDQIAKKAEDMLKGRVT